MRLEEFIKEGARRHPEKLAVVAARRTLSFADLDAMSGSLGAVLAAGGIRRNDRVALFMETSWEAVVATFAVLKSGAVVSPVDSAHDAKELTRVLRDHRVRGLITGTRLAAKAASAISSTPAVDVIVLAGAGNVRTAPGCFGFEDAIVGLSHHAPAHDGTDLDDAIVLRSAQAVGGTAEATVGHRAAVAATEAIAQSFVDDGSEGVTSAAPLSAEHGLYQMFAAMKLGATFVLERTLVISAADGGGARSSIRRHSQPPPYTATRIATDSDSGSKEAGDPHAALG